MLEENVLEVDYWVYHCSRLFCFGAILSITCEKGVLTCLRACPVKHNLIDHWHFITSEASGNVDGLLYYESTVCLFSGMRISDDMRGDIFKVI